MDERWQAGEIRRRERVLRGLELLRQCAVLSREAPEVVPLVDDATLERMVVHERQVLDRARGGQEEVQALPGVSALAPNARLVRVALAFSEAWELRFPGQEPRKDLSIDAAREVVRWVRELHKGRSAPPSKLSETPRRGENASPPSSREIRASSREEENLLPSAAEVREHRTGGTPPKALRGRMGRLLVVCYALAVAVMTLGYAPWRLHVRDVQVSAGFAPIWDAPQVGKYTAVFDGVRWFGILLGLTAVFGCALALRWLLGRKNRRF